MLKEYCDRCGKEIDHNDSRAKYKVRISLESPRDFREHATNFMVCKDCYEKMKIREYVERTQTGNYQKKDTDAVEKRMDIVRELITECMEERGYGN